ncbi:hypothetical protein HRI_002876900 [Hibiscus trionum]|uniref:Uncharacterized protein n=1 Tax=Hibiscus trionum TaxID=183268 RepID=A0A9W7M972_HIBTR|nr:hypothetical protein HRI_002876900 [Hibiscus trionum]
MESSVSSPTKKQNQTLPPRRGKVKKRIVKGFLKSVTSMVSSIDKELPSKMKQNGPGPGLSSTSTTPAPTPTTYDSG